MTSNKRVLLIAHGHPQLSPGGGEIVAYKLYQAIRDSGLAEPYYLGAMLPQFGATPLRVGAHARQRRRRPDAVLV